MNIKKGILGLDTVRVVLVTLLVLAVTAIAVFLALVSLQNTNLFVDDSDTITVTNESGDGSVFANITGYTLADVNSSNSGYTLTGVLNGTDDTVQALANFTVSDAGVLTNATDITWENLSISYTYTFTFESRAESDTNLIIGNVTSGTTQFFANVPTYMILLGVVVLLLIIAIVLVVVGRFGGPTNVRQEL